MRVTAVMATVRRAGMLAAVVVVTGALSTTGCAPTSCSSVLFLDAVVVHVASPADFREVTDLRVCVGSRCAERPFDRTVTDQSIPLPLGAGRRTIDVTGRDSAGRQLVGGSAVVNTVVSEPDGPGCQSVHLAKVTLSGTGLAPTG